MRRPTRREALGLLLAAAAGPALAAPSARLIDERWTRFGTGAGPDTSRWAGFLARYLARGADGVMRVDYAAAAAEGARDGLRRHLDAMARVEPAGLARPAAMAFWIDLYNALTIDLVLEAWPVDSIREVRGGLFNTGPWDEAVIRVAGADLSLDDIEHGILRPVWRDPRIHYAVNCASVGCPDLAPEPYSAGRLEAMLDAGARTYVGHPRGVTPGAEGLVVSSIYHWFEADFGGSEAGVIRHLAAHAAPESRAEIEAAEGIADHRYDWSINAISRDNS